MISIVFLPVKKKSFLFSVSYGNTFCTTFQIIYLMLLFFLRSQKFVFSHFLQVHFESQIYLDYDFFLFLKFFFCNFCFFQNSIFLSAWKSITTRRYFRLCGTIYERRQGLYINVYIGIHFYFLFYPQLLFEFHYSA